MSVSMIWGAGDMTIPKPTLKSKILQNLSPRLSKILDEIDQGALTKPTDDTAFLDDVFRFSSQTKPD